ncbi:uncharacterized protein LOC129613086 [Condylostylus longicornis]|uniref:uncharacterized protein LOC129613086 n=1 Tax=Condylostylus longicornis TaxID=2530218 RepID=UPI00244DBB60|nr:uncharacterized protein LOC129613086 [Condylostylus longicornis]XP_055382979.1 uncharacterized protein LOC129613086 [Condylostylus longicornis]
MGTGAIEYNPPEWLTQSFLEEILRDHFNDVNINVSNLRTISLVKTNGYASILHKCQFKYTKDNENFDKFSLIIKEHPKGLSGILAFKHKLFKREILIYKDILPRIQDLLRTINETTKIAPICYYTTETPEPFLILEDMTYNQYEMFERNRLFNLQQVIPVIEKIAKFHACSVIIAEQNPGIMDFFEEGPISDNPDRQNFLGFFPASIKELAEEVAKWQGFEEICEKLYRLEKTIISKGKDLFKSNKDEFRVLNLGDLWISNVMIKVDEQLLPEDVVLLDYQLAYYGSPAIDLNYFLYGSLNENVRKVHYKYIIKEYHQILNKTLSELNYTGYIPTLKDLHIKIIKKSLMAVIAASCLTPLIFNGSDENPDENDNRGTGMLDTDSIPKKLNLDENPKYKAFIQRTLKEFDLSGFLD